MISFWDEDHEYITDVLNHFGINTDFYSNKQFPTFKDIDLLELYNDPKIDKKICGINVYWNQELYKTFFFLRLFLHLFDFHEQDNRNLILLTEDDFQKKPKPLLTKEDIKFIAAVKPNLKDSIEIFLKKIRLINKRDELKDDFNLKQNIWELAPDELLRAYYKGNLMLHKGNIAQVARSIYRDKLAQFIDDEEGYQKKHKALKSRISTELKNLGINPTEYKKSPTSS